MALDLSPEAKAYAEKKGLTSWDLGNKSILRPEVGYNLTLKVARSGKQILCTNGGDIAIIKRGDRLKMSNFNRFVKRAFQLQSKSPVFVTVTANKQGMDGVKLEDRFMPFDALRGYVSFSMAALVNESTPLEDGVLTLGSLSVLMNQG